MHALASPPQDENPPLRRGTNNVNQTAVAMETTRALSVHPLMSHVPTHISMCRAAKHSGLTAEEMNFIINHDIHYRMGDPLKGGE